MSQQPYAKLRGKIIEVCGTNEQFAREMGFSKTILSRKLNRNAGWSYEEMLHACEVLNIDVSKDISLYFFAE